MTFTNIINIIQKLNKHGAIILKNKEILTNHRNNVKMINSITMYMGNNYVETMTNKNKILTEKEIENIHNNQYKNISEFEYQMRELNKNWDKDKTSINKYWYEY